MLAHVLVGEPDPTRRDMRLGRAVRDHTELSDPERTDWLRLIRSDNVGPRTFRMLLAHCGSASAALEALPELARRGGAGRQVRTYSRREAERELDAARSLGLAYVALCESVYPSVLGMLDDAPPLLAVRGDATALGKPMVAIVGSRNASAAGAKFASMLAHDLGQAGFVIVSGLARGIDAAAHRASVGTGTVAVLAGGHDRIYPPEHRGLLDAMLTTGAAVSEMPLGWEPRARDFPRRNRLIAGLSRGVVVVEAAHRSGSLITVRFALEQGREVFAVPGSPLDPRAAGTNGLLKQGATLVTETSDVIAVLAPILGSEMPSSAEVPLPSPPAASRPEDLVGARARIQALLGPTPVGLDDIARLADASVADVRVAVLELELAGRIERHGGGLVSLR